MFDFFGKVEKNQLLFFLSIETTYTTATITTKEPSFFVFFTSVTELLLPDSQSSFL